MVWQSYQQDGSNYGVFGQRFASGGARRGGEFRANTYTSSFQLGASVSSEPDGDFVVAWQSNLQDGNGMGIFAQQRLHGALLGRHRWFYIWLRTGVQATSFASRSLV